MDPMYLDDIESCYIDNFKAVILDMANDGRYYLILDRTAMYPTGGGQPSDTGIVEWDGGSCSISEVRKKDRILHYIEGEPPKKGDQVTVHVNWVNRISHMRMHTAQHILSSIIWRRYHARTVGNQIQSDRSHIDFHPLSIDEGTLKDIEKEVNGLINGCHNVQIIFRDRSFFEGVEDVQRIDLDRVPSDIRTLRSVEIGEGGSIDTCPCAGTHIRNTCEIGKVRMIGRWSKGKERTRIEYSLEP